MSQIIQIKRTPTPNNPPASLALGELALGVGNAPCRVWVGTSSGVQQFFNMHVAYAPPAGAVAGDLWFNPATSKVMYFDGGTNWWLVNQVEYSLTGPTPRPDGSLWVHSTTHVLSVAYNQLGVTYWDPVTGNRSKFALTPDPNAVEGDIWWSPTGIQVFDGTNWFYALIDGGDF